MVSGLGEMRSHFKTLGISLNASEVEAKKAYRVLALKFHPDRGGSEEKFKSISAAYTEVRRAIKKRPFVSRDSFNGQRAREQYAYQQQYWDNINRSVCGFDLRFDIFVYSEQLKARVKQRFTYLRDGKDGGSEDVHLLVSIPPGAVYGDVLKFSGCGGYGRGSGGTGDLYLKLRKKPGSRSHDE